MWLGPPTIKRKMQFLALAGKCGFFGDIGLTEEPAVYGFVRFIDDRPEMPTTENALGLHENQDLMDKMHKNHGRKGSKYKPIQAYTRTVRHQDSKNS